MNPGTSLTISDMGPSFTKEQWRGVSIERRQKYIAREMHVNHPDFVKSANEIKRRMKRCINETRGSAVLFLVPSGGGKSHMCNFLKTCWPNEHTDTLTKIRVVQFDIPPSPNSRSMGQALLSSLGDNCWKTGSAFEIQQRIKKLLPVIQTEVILIDNVQDIPEKRKKAGIMEVGNWIRDLIDSTERLVVLLGTPSAKEVIIANSQLRRRTSKVLEMDYFDIHTSINFARFKRVLNKIDQQLPIADYSSLSDDKTAAAIFYATNGILDYIIQLFVEAIGVCVAKKREKLEIEDLAAAFVLVFQDAATTENNPFTVGGPHRPLKEKNEPFHNWFDSSNPRLHATSVKQHEGGKGK